MQTHARGARLLLVTVVAAGAAVCAATRCWSSRSSWLDPARTATTSAASLDSLLGPLAAAGVAACLFWLAASVVLAAAAHLPGRLGAALAPVVDAVTPRVLRRVTAMLIGGALAVPGSPALAATPVAGESASSSSLDRPAADLDAVRDRPQAPASVTQISVAPGDTLWGLAAAHLASPASAADIARAWPRWYAVNRSVIGSDPDRIHPGQVLRVPAAPEPGNRETEESS